MPDATKLISTTTLTSSVAQISFSDIPQDATDLLLLMSSRCDVAANGTSLFMAINGSTSSFTTRRMYGNGNGSVTQQQNTPSANYFGETCGTSTTASTFGSLRCYIPNYSSSATKTFDVYSVNENNGITSYQMLTQGTWGSSAAITSFSLTVEASGNFVAGTVASLYSITKGSGGATVS